MNASSASKVPEVTLYFWIIKILATTLGETGGDAVTMSMNLGYLIGTAIFAALFVVAVSAQIGARRFHPFLYWATIMFSQTLGTALGDWMADPVGLGLGYEGGAVVFSACLLMVVVAYFYTNISRTFLFWAAFILTRPLGATLGDFIDKPLAQGGLGLSRYIASAVLAAVI